MAHKSSASSKLSAATSRVTMATFEPGRRLAPLRRALVSSARKMSRRAPLPMLPRRNPAPKVDTSPFLSHSYPSNLALHKAPPPPNLKLPLQGPSASRESRRVSPRLPFRPLGCSIAPKTSLPVAETSTVARTSSSALCRIRSCVRCWLGSRFRARRRSSCSLS